MTAAHSTVFLPTDTIETPCRGCSAVLLVPANAEPPHLCRACRKSQQEADAWSILSQVRALAAGEAPMFDLLTADERRVHLSQLATCLEYARRVTLAVPVVPVSPAVRAIALAHYEAIGDEPSDAEKQAIYAMEEIIDIEETREAETRDWR